MYLYFQGKHIWEHKVLSLLQENHHADHGVPLPEPGPWKVVFTEVRSWLESAAPSSWDCLPPRHSVCMHTLPANTNTLVSQKGICAVDENHFHTQRTWRQNPNGGSTPYRWSSCFTLLRPIYKTSVWKNKLLKCTMLSFSFFFFFFLFFLFFFFFFCLRAKERRKRKAKLQHS